MKNTSNPKNYKEENMLVKKIYHYYLIIICIQFYFIFTCKLFSQVPEPLQYNIINSIASPGPSPFGLTWDGEYLWVSDDSTKIIYKIDSDNGNIILSFQSPGSSPKGLSWDGNNLILIENQTAKIYILSASINNLGLIIKDIDLKFISESLYIKGQATGLTYDGEYIYCCFKAGWSSQIIKIKSSENTATFFTYTRGNPNGLAYDGNYIWNCVDNGGTRSGFVDNYDFHSGIRINRFITPGYQPTGIVYDGKYFWLADKYYSKIYKIEIIR